MNGMTATNVEVDVAFWVLSIGMGVAFAASGAMKLVVSRKRLALGVSARRPKRDDGPTLFRGASPLVGQAVLLPCRDLFPAVDPLH